MAEKILFYLLLLLPGALAAQTIATKKETARIDGTNINGYQIVIASSRQDVNLSLSRYLKALGRIKSSGDYITLTEPVIGGRKYPGILYATTKDLGNTSAAWIGVPSESGEESSLNRDVQKLVYDFAVSFYREKVQLQIDESLRALQAVEKQQLRLETQNTNLNNRIESNKLEKIQLEKSLLENKTELDELSRKLAANSKAQDSVAIATEQIRKVVEMHKEKQRSIK